MAEKNVNEQKVQKKSEKDKNGVIGGVVFGIILLFLTYQIYDLLFEFPIGQGDADKILDQLRVRRFICILTKTASVL